MKSKKFQQLSTKHTEFGKIDWDKLLLLTWLVISRITVSVWAQAQSQLVVIVMVVVVVAAILLVVVLFLVVAAPIIVAHRNLTLKLNQ